MRKVLLCWLFIACASVLSAQDMVRDSLELDKGFASSLTDIVKGRISGVRVSSIDGAPDGAKNINIRGLNSLRGNNMPLIVVDGCIIGMASMQNLEAFFQYGENGYTNPFNVLGYLNVYDIEKIEVLKNVSATALYGSKGADGVILVTTKSNKDEDKLTVDWNSNVGVSVPSHAGDDAGAAVSHNHWLRAGGMMEKASYSMSAFYNDIQGVAGNASSQRGGLRTNFETRTNEKIWFGLNSSLVISAMSIPSTGAWYGKPSLGTVLRGIDLVGADIESCSGWKEDYDDDAKDFRTTNSIYLQVNFMPQLKWKTTFGLDFDNVTRYIWYGKGTQFGYDYNGAASIVTSKTMSYNGRTELDYKVYLAGKHLVNANVGANIEGDWNKFSTMNGADFWTHQMRARGLSIASSKAVIRDFNYRFFHFATSATLVYDYAGIAGIKGLARLDTTPRYDDWKMAVYPSVEAYFDVKKAFIANSEVLSGLRLSAGWGRSGKESFVPYQLMSRYTTGAYPEVSDDLACFYESLSVLKSSEFNVSLEAGFLDGRLNAKVGYYMKSTADRIDMYCFGKAGNDGIVWVNSPRTRLYAQQAEVGNRGIEFDLSAKIIDVRDWKWTASLNCAYNENQIRSVDIPDRLGRMVGSGVLANVNVLGYPVGSIYGYELDGNGEYKDQTGDGRLTAVDKTIIGNTQPKVFGAFNTTLSYKDFLLDLQLDGAAGFSLLNMNRMIADNETMVSEKYAERADFLRLGRVSFAWNIPYFKDVRWIDSARITLSAYNLFTVSRYDGWNPDVNSFGISNLSTGFDYGSYPVARTILLGVGFNF